MRDVSSQGTPVTLIHKLNPFEEVSSTGDPVITVSYMQQTTEALPSGKGVPNI